MKRAKRRPLPSLSRLLAVEEMRQLMANAPRGKWVADLKALIDEGRADGVILDAMLDQMAKTTLSAESAIDNALAEIAASNRRVEAMERAARQKIPED